MVIGKALGFLSVFFISFFFGATKQTDVFYFGQSFVGLAGALFTSQVNTIFVPLFIKLKEKSESEAWDFASSLFSYTTVLSIGTSLILIWNTKNVFSSISKFDSSTLSEAHWMLPLFFVIFCQYVITDFLRSLIQANQQFTFPAKIVLVNNFIMLISIVLLSPWVGVTALAIGVLLGYCIQAVLMFLYLGKRQPLFRFSLQYVSVFNRFFKLSIPVFLAQIFGSFSIFFYDYLSSGFSGGILTAISLAQRLVSLPVEMLVMPYSTVVMPFYCESFAKRDLDGLFTMFMKGNNFLWFIMVPMSVFACANNYEIVEIFFKRGSFSVENTIVVAQIFEISVVGLIGSSFVALNTRLLYAIQKSTFVSALSFIAGTSSMILTYLMVSKIGYLGIPGSKTISILLLSMMPQLVVTRYFHRKFDIIVTLKKMFSLLGISFVALLVSKMVDRSHVVLYLLLDVKTLHSPFVHFLLLAGAFSVCYLFLAKTLGADDNLLRMGTLSSAVRSINGTK